MFIALIIGLLLLIFASRPGGEQVSKDLGPSLEGVPVGLMARIAAATAAADADRLRALAEELQDLGHDDAAREVRQAADQIDRMKSIPNVPQPPPGSVEIPAPVIVAPPNAVPITEPETPVSIEPPELRSPGLPPLVSEPPAGSVPLPETVADVVDDVAEGIKDILTPKPKPIPVVAAPPPDAVEIPDPDIIIPSPMPKAPVLVPSPPPGAVEVPVTAPKTGLIRSGDKGPQVEALQRRLLVHGYDPGKVDGIFGPRTLGAVKGFQKAKGLKVDGIVGPKTQAALAKAPTAKATPVPAPGIPVVPSPPPGAVEVAPPAAPPKKRATVRSGSRGPDVEYLQERLNAAGHNAGNADGIFGPKTLAAVKSFQRAEGLSADGIVGPMTWAAIEAQQVISGDRGKRRGPSAGAVTRMLYASGPHGPAKDVGALRRYKRQAGVLTAGNLYDVPTARSLVARGIVPPTPFDFGSRGEQKQYAEELKWRAARDPARREEWMQALSALE